MCWLCACTPLSDLGSYSAGTPPPAVTADASASPPTDVPPEIVIGPFQPGPDAAAPVDAGPVPDAAADAGACDGPGEAVGPGGQGCYRFVAVAATWNAAQLECVSWGGWLVTAKSEAEDDYLATRTGGSDIWIGLSDVADEGQMVWIDGAPLGTANWAAAQPDNFQNEDCVEKRGQDAFWNDRACAAPHAYICER
ncbi:MAG: C-type lectin domain-containing protein [Polyangiaceae bacterium]